MNEPYNVVFGKLLYDRTIMNLWRLFSLISLALTTICLPRACAMETFTIGWQAPNGPASVYNLSNATFDYVGAQLGVQFEIQPYATDAALTAAPVDFWYSNPVNMYCIILAQNVQPLVTINNLDPATHRIYSTLSGSIITMNTSGIFTYQDIIGKVVGAGQFTGLTTFTSEFNLLQQNNVSLFTQSRTFVGYGTNLQIVQAVLAGDIDVGFVTSSQLTTMAANGTDVSSIDIVQPMTYANSPFISSTPTYSSSVLAASTNINNTFRTKLVAALLELEPGSPTNIKASVAGWVIPQSFLLIRKLMQATGSLTPAGNTCTSFDSIYGFV